MRRAQDRGLGEHQSPPEPVGGPSGVQGQSPALKSFPEFYTTDWQDAVRERESVVATVKMLKWMVGMHLALEGAIVGILITVLTVL